MENRDILEPSCIVYFPLLAVFDVNLGFSLPDKTRMVTVNDEYFHNSTMIRLAQTTVNA